MPHSIIYTGLSDERANDFINKNTYIINEQDTNVKINIVGSTIGSHLGPNVLGVAFFTK